jgi:hypothetical protein
VLVSSVMLSMMSLMMVSLVVSMVLVVVSMVLVVVFMVAFVVVSSMVVFVVVSSMMVLVMTFSMMVVFMMVSVVVSVMVLVVMSVVVSVMVSMMFVVFVSVVSMMFVMVLVVVSVMVSMMFVMVFVVVSVMVSMMFVVFVSVMSMMVLSMVVFVMVLSMMVLVVSMVVFGVLSGGALDWLLVVSSRSCHSGGGLISSCSSRSSLVSSHNVGDFSSALFLASREDIVSASCSDIGSDVTASCVGECLAVGAVLVAWSALVGAFLSFLLSAVEVGLRVRSANIEGLSIAVTSLWDIVWLESLCSCSALSRNDLSAPGSNEGCNGSASCNGP